MENWAIWVALISAAAAIASTLLNIVQNRTTRKTLQARIITEFTERYADDDMNEAIVAMKRFYLENRSDFIGVWIQLRKEDPENYHYLFAMRRRINRYYRSIYKLVCAGSIDRRTARILLDDFALNVYYQVVIPISQTHTDNPEGYRRVEKTLKKILPRYGGGRIENVLHTDGN